MKVTVLGLGYIGLPTAAVISNFGHDVLGVDLNESVVDTINQGRIHIVEEGLEKLVRKSIESGTLRASNAPEESDIFIISVPTPFKENNEPDLSYIEQAAESISSFLSPDNLVILESTVPVRATERLVSILKSNREDLSFPEYKVDGRTSDVNIAHCPERVLPGNILHELVHNDRTIGGITKECSKKAKEFYSSFVEGVCNTTDSRTAELSKLVENSFRDVNIAFANELSLIADKLDIDVWDLIEISNFHPRVNILQPGPGVGGHCIAVDPWFIVSSAPEEAKLITLSREINDKKPDFVMNKIIEALDKLEKGSHEITVATLGLSFKPNIDDLRESPALLIAERISALQFKKHLIVEPNIEKLPEELQEDRVFLVDIATAMEESDLLVLLVDHKEFFSIEKSILENKIVIDTKGIIR